MNDNRKERNRGFGKRRFKRLLMISFVSLIMMLVSFSIIGSDESTASAENSNGNIINLSSVEGQVRITSGGDYHVKMESGADSVSYTILINVPKTDVVNLTIENLNIDVGTTTNGQSYNTVISSDTFDYDNLPCPIGVLSGNVTIKAVGTNTLTGGLMGIPGSETNNVAISGAGIWVGPNSTVTLIGDAGSKIISNGCVKANPSGTKWFSNTFGGSGIGACGASFYNNGISSSSGMEITKMGHLIIDGEVSIEAVGKANYAPGIGGGDGGNQTVTIKGGNVTATGNGVGIGVGFRGSSLTINAEGGTVNARPNTDGIGIGTYSLLSTTVNLNVSGNAVVNAYGSTSLNGKTLGVGIGTSTSVNNINVTVSGGKLHAEGPVGIGSYNSSNKTITLKITGGTVEAIGTERCAIGINNSSSNNLSITGGTLVLESVINYGPTLTYGESSVTIEGIGFEGNVPILNDILSVKPKAEFSHIDQITMNGKKYEGLWITGTITKEGSKTNTTYFGFLYGYYEYYNNDETKTKELHGDSTVADEIIKKLNEGPIDDNVALNIANFLKEVNPDYEALDLPQRLYVDNKAKHTISDYKKKIDGQNISVNIILKAQEDSPGNEATVRYGEIPTITVPTKKLFSFAGWYYKDKQITDENGKFIEKSSFLGGETLEAKWDTTVVNVDSALCF